MNIDLGLKSICTLAFWRAVAAEFFGMVLFLLCVTTVAIPWAGQTVVEIGIGIGLSITSIAVMIGHVSGGHLNPAVTVGCIIGGRISVIKGLFYIIAQTLGGILLLLDFYYLTTIVLHPLDNDDQRFLDNSEHC